MENKYIPGVCNIGKKETEFRRNFGIAGVTLSVVTAIVLFLLGVPSIFRIIIFFPVFAAAFGLLQAYFHFCAEFAMVGVFNFSDTLRKTESVPQAESRRKDQIKGLKILALSFIIGSIAAILFILV
ncbi:MAG: hypothetical protein ABIM99_02240 [Candidatus Dojkabacteria bacterium]